MAGCVRPATGGERVSLALVIEQLRVELIENRIARDARRAEQHAQAIGLARTGFPLQAERIISSIRLTSVWLITTSPLMLIYTR